MSFYREQAIEAAKVYLESNPIFLDTETTGLGQRDEIVEISILDYDGTVLLETLVKPGRKIPYDASRIHGITEKMVLNAPAWFHVWPKVEEIINRALDDTLLAREVFLKITEKN